MKGNNKTPIPIKDLFAGLLPKMYENQWKKLTVPLILLIRLNINVLLLFRTQKLFIGSSK